MAEEKYKSGEENLSLTTLSPQKDKNRNIRVHVEENEGLLFAFFSILIRYGHGILGLSYTLEKTRRWNGRAKYFIRKNSRAKRVYAVIYTFICLYWFIKATGERSSVTNFQIINWIKRGIHVVLMLEMIILKYYLEKAESHNTLLTMLKGADDLQEKFAKCNIFILGKAKVRSLGYSIMGVTGIWTVIQTFLFLTAGGRGTKRFASLAFRFCTLGLVDADEYLNPSLVNFFCCIGVILDSIPTAMFHFVDTICIFSILSIWIIFYRLTRAVDSGGVLEHKSLAKIMDLHLSTTQILHLMNKLFSSLTFISTLYIVLYVCYWANTVIAAQEFCRTYIVALFFLIKSIFILLMAADVNSKAHSITYWLEKYARQNPTSTLVDPNAVSIWTCQLYNKDTIGFKGLNYFTITSSFISGMVGLIITYTAVVVQFLEMERNPIPKS